MTIRDLYRKPEKAYIPFTESEIQILHNTPASGGESVTPTREEIAQAQLKAAKDLYPHNPQLAEFIRTANLDFGKQFTDDGDDSAVITEVIESIENALGLWYETSSPGSAGTIHTTITKEETEASLIKYRNMLHNLQIMYNNLSDVDDSFIQDKIKIIKTAIDDLTADLKNYQSDNFVPRGSLHGGYVDKAIYLGHALKGRYLEVAATEWFGQRIPDNVKVVDTGRVYGVTYDIFGNVKSSGKQLKSDIMAFDMNLADAVQITYMIGNEKKGPVSLSTFLADVEAKSGSETISIDNDNYQALTEALVFGAQAKSGRNQTIFNKASTAVSLNDVVSLNATEKFGKALQLIIRAASIDKSNIIKKQPMYDAMFNFLLAKHLSYIIGKENNLIVTRSGIWTVYDYMKHQWDTAKRIVQAYQRVDVSNATKKTPLEYKGFKGN